MQVYFIQRGEAGPIKIGFSTNPEKRLRNLQTANPEPLRLLYATYGTETYEGELHEKFAEYCIHGEWFQPAPALLNFIRAAKAPPRRAKRPIPCEACGGPDIEAAECLPSECGECDGTGVIYV